MQYRSDKKGNAISILGFGCMRFTKNGGTIDYEKAGRELMLAISEGVNYLDTAYIYSGSEALLGRFLEENNCRDKVYIATKLPHYLIKSISGAERIFNEELKRLRTDHIDYYLMHMLNDVSTWEKLVKMGIDKWIEEKMASGQIRNIGFSYHGNTDNFKPLIDAYDWDFCQVQYNYLDEHSQAGRRGVEYAASKGIPVIIMEPLRGGRLADSLPAEAAELVRKDPRKRSAAELAFRWLWNQPEITCILSGMNSEEMVRENIRVASDVRAGEFTQDDLSLIDGLKKAINQNMKVGCTGCAYCMPCPKNVDIPEAFHCLNLSVMDRKAARWEYIQTTVMRKQTSGASQCIGCGKCEKHCPQHLPIRQKLKEASAELETPKYKFMKSMVRLFHIY
ncbi:MAG: aldo/keto reductase [Parasporobacterium sp.]|nr:aldo/keto reductase [Parasporobacterium sp.]